MDNIIELQIMLKDLMSSGMYKVAVNSKKAMNNAEASIQSVEKASKIAGNNIMDAAKITQRSSRKSVRQLENELDALEEKRDLSIDLREIRKADREIKELNDKLDRTRKGIGGGIGGNISKWRGDFAQSMPGADIISNPLTIAGGIMGGLFKSFQSAAKAGMQKTQLKVLAGDKRGTQMYKQLTKFATDTVFGSEVYGMSAKLMQLGISANKVLPTMKMLGDISMGNAAKMDRLSVALGQVKGRGHLTAEELNQMIDAGFNPLNVMAKQTGLSMGELRARMRKGQITFMDVKKAMQGATGPGGKFQNMLQKIAKTPYGQLQQLGDQLQQMMIKIGQVAIPIASKIMSVMSWIGEKMGPFLKPIAIVLGILAAGLLVVAAAQWVWNIAQLANPVAWIIIGIVALIGVIIYLASNITGLGKAWDHTVKGMKLLFQAFVAGVKFYWATAINGIMIGVNKILRMYYKAKNFLGIGSEEANNKAIAQLEKDTQSRIDNIKNAGKEVVQLSKQAASEFGQAINSVGWKGKSISEVSEDTKKAFGIPTSPSGHKPLNGAGGGSNLAGGTGGAVAAGVTSGGPKSITINVNREMIGKLSINSYNVREGVGQLEKLVEESLRRLLYSAAAEG